MKIAALTCDQLEMPPSGMTITLGANPAAVRVLVAPLFWEHVSSRRNQQTTNPGTD